MVGSLEAGNRRHLKSDASTHAAAGVVQSFLSNKGGD